MRALQPRTRTKGCLLKSASRGASSRDFVVVDSSPSVQNCRGGLVGFELTFLHRFRDAELMRQKQQKALEKQQQGK
jgi:hypothetical protein